MSGLGEHNYEFIQAGGQATPNELDRYERINTGILSIDASWFGTAASGTASQARAMVIINKTADFPRNILYGVVGTADCGGSWTVNGRDQFGGTITETVALATAAAGTPARAVAGTKIFADVASGTFTPTSTTVGGALGRIGAAIGTSTTAAFKLGLLTKIGSTADVKSITWTTENVVTTLGGGTPGAYVDATNHAFTGTSIMAGTESYNVLLKSSWDNKGKADLTLL